MSRLISQTHCSEYFNLFKENYKNRNIRKNGKHILKGDNKQKAFCSNEKGFPSIHLDRRTKNYQHI